MGKIVTYIIYILIAIAIFVFIRAAFMGDINANTTLGDAATEVKNGSIQTIKEITNEASNAVNNIEARGPASAQ